MSLFKSAYLADTAAQVIKLAKILRLLRIIKMLRVLKVGELVSRMETIVGKSITRVLYLMTAAVLVTHIVACLFYYTAYLSDLTVRRSVARSRIICPAVIIDIE